MTEIVPLATVPPEAVEALLDRAFEPGRRARTAYKVRGAADPIAALSFAALDAETLVGTIQCWPVAFTGDEGSASPLVMVGPVAVEPARQRDGIGRRLMAHALGEAARLGLDRAMTLIGDPEYYGRFFGFTAEATGGWRLPGPVERRRLLARGADVPEGAGVLGPRGDCAESVHRHPGLVPGSSVVEAMPLDREVQTRPALDPGTRPG